MPYDTVNLPCTGIASFCKFPIRTDLSLLAEDVAVFGVPWDEGTGYRPGSRMGPRAIREYSTRFAFGERGASASGYFDVESGERRLERTTFADCGDLDILYTRVDETFDALTGAIENILSRKAFPVVLGGDHSISFPVVRAFSDYAPLSIFQIDAHLDYTDEVRGVKLANGSPIKRISELPFIDRIVQIGIRGIRANEAAFRDSAARGNLIVLASDLRREGTAAIASRFPRGGNIYVTVDIDGLDPSIAPGTGSPCPDGLLYRELRDLLRAIAGCGKVVGMDLVEVNPFLDPTGRTASLAVQTILELLSAVFG
jgi:agmatinase